MSRCWRKTGNGSSLSSRLGCLCGIDRIGCLTLLPLSTVAGLVTLAIGVTGNTDCPFNWLKDSQECELISPSKFLCCASA